MIWYLRRVLGLVLVVLLIAQAFRIDHTNPPVQQDVAAPPEVDVLLRRACHASGVPPCSDHRRALRSDTPMDAPVDPTDPWILDTCLTGSDRPPTWPVKMRSCASNSRSPAGKSPAHGYSSHASAQPGGASRSSSNPQPSCAGTDKPSSSSGVASPSARERRRESPPTRSPSSRPWPPTTGCGAPSGSAGSCSSSTSASPSARSSATCDESDTHHRQAWAGPRFCVTTRTKPGHAISCKPTTCSSDQSSRSS